MLVLVFDTETTNIIDKSINMAMNNIQAFPYIIQLAWIVFDTDTQISTEHDFILKIPVKIDNKDIHGISKDVSDKGYLFSEIFCIFMDDYNKADVIVGHNENFDLNMLEIELLRINEYDSIDILYNKVFYDTMIQATKIGNRFKLTRYPKLMNLYQLLFNEGFNDAHNALGDVRATLRIYLEMTK